MTQIQPLVHSKLLRIVSFVEKSTELSFTSLSSRLTLNYWLAISTAHVVAWIFEEYYANPAFNSLWLRVLVCMVSLPLFLIASGFFQLLKEHIRLYFIAVMWLLLPFMFSMLCIQNLAVDRDSNTVSSIWLYQYFVATTIFFGLFSNLKLTLCLTILAQGIALLIFLFTTRFEASISIGVSFGMLATSLTVYCFSFLTHEKLAFVDRQKVKAAYGVGARVAHELRTPLLSIKNFARTALSDLSGIDVPPHDIERSKRFLEKIVGETEYSNRTIDLLLVTTSTPPHSQVGREILSAEALITDVIATFPYSNSGEIDQIEYSSDGQDFYTRASSRLIKHVLMNLVKNALQETKPRDQEQIILGRYKEKNKGYIYVKDNGPGVLEENRKRIFDNFFTTRRDGDGTGIGLAFCKSVMRDIGGNIEYFRKDKMSVFLLTFPINKES